MEALGPLAVAEQDILTRFAHGSRCSPFASRPPFGRPRTARSNRACSDDAPPARARLTGRSAPRSASRGAHSARATRASPFQFARNRTAPQITRLPSRFARSLRSLAHPSCDAVSRREARGSLRSPLASRRSLRSRLDTLDGARHRRRQLRRLSPDSPGPSAKTPPCDELCDTLRSGYRA